MSFLQGEKRQLAKANKEETEETEEEEVSEMHIETGSPSQFQKWAGEPAQLKTG